MTAIFYAPIVIQFNIIGTAHSNQPFSAAVPPLPAKLVGSMRLGQFIARNHYHVRAKDVSPSIVLAKNRRSSHVIGVARREYEPHGRNIVTLQMWMVIGVRSEW
jgi:hypothetical protein